MRSLYFLFCLLSFTLVFSQEDSTRKYSPKNRKHEAPKNRFFTGGGLGLQFGNPTLIDISPIVGYKITEKLSVGVSPSYKYYKVSHPSFGTYSLNIYGGGVFSRYMLTDFLFAHAEHETLYAKWIENRRPFSITSVFIGGGYLQRISENMSVYLLALWNINDGVNSPYQNPVIRAGIGLGF